VVDLTVATVLAERHCSLSMAVKYRSLIE